VDAKHRLLFCSYHGYLDPSSGAALATRDLLELLSQRGWSCKVFCGPRLDYEVKRPFDQLLAVAKLEFAVSHGLAGKSPFSLYEFRQEGVPVSALDLPDASPHEPPSKAEAKAFLSLYEKVLDEFHPDIFLTYGGQRLQPDVIGLAKKRGVRVVFVIHNFLYESASLFEQVDAILVPSRCAQEHYRKTLGLESTVIPGPWNWERVRCSEIERKYVTFVNPSPEKGLFLFASIADELAQRRPDIPMLVVEGRARVNWLPTTGLDLTGRGNVFVMANTPDPRDFYRVTKIILMPSLWRESFPRVPVEAFINGIPVLASRRGGLPEALEAAGFLFDVPAQYTPESRVLPSAAEVELWTEAIICLWDDAQLYEKQQEHCLLAAEAWRPDHMARQFEEFFLKVLGPQFETEKPPKKHR
jgi:glycosyltransferase involved in cell wall biosynthesis